MSYQWIAADATMLRYIDGSGVVTTYDPFHPDWGTVSIRGDILPYEAPPTPPVPSRSVDMRKFAKALVFHAPNGTPWVVGARAYAVWRNAFWSNTIAGDEIWNRLEFMAVDNADLLAALMATILTNNGGLPIFTSTSARDAAIVTIFNYADGLSI